MNNFPSLCILFEPNWQTFAPNTVMLIAAMAIITVFLMLLNKRPFAILMWKNPGTRTATVVVAQVLVLLTFQAKYAHVVENGRMITLAAQPADPFDFFRGYFLTLKYDISRLNRFTTTFHMTPPSADNTVYVVLEQTGKVWQASDVYTVKPENNQGQVILKGQATNISADDISVHYGLEQYFYPEGAEVDFHNGAIAYWALAK